MSQLNHCLNNYIYIFKKLYILWIVQKNLFFLNQCELFPGRNKLAIIFCFVQIFFLSVELHFFKKKIQSNNLCLQCSGKVCISVLTSQWFLKVFLYVFIYLFIYLMQYSDICLTSRSLSLFVWLGEDEFWEFIYTVVDAVLFPQQFYVSPMRLCCIKWFT